MARQRGSLPGAGLDGDARPIKSTTAWLVLGLLIEKPSYVYEVFKRFERRYEGLQPATTSRMYSAFQSLEDEALIEAMDRVDTPAGTRRQPKVHYRATARGAEEWKRELVERFEEESQRPALLSRVLAASALDDAMVLAVLDHLERQLLEQRGSLISPAQETSPESRASFGVRLAGEYQRVVLHAQFMFLDWAREELRARAKAHGSDHNARGDGAARS